MQKRHLDRSIYFKELANTSREFYVDYIRHFIPVGKGCRVLEIGCGEGGNLLPFAESGCEISGVDIAEHKITNARNFFFASGYPGIFIAMDFLKMEIPSEKYDLLLIHDVIEHIPLSEKEAFIRHAKAFLKADGIMFWAFPAWQMPFGGHQQMCRSKIGSRLPFFHLLPKAVYAFTLKILGENPNCIRALIETKRDRVTVEKFEKLLKQNDCIIIHRRLWFINPHYRQKFHLKPRKLNPYISKIRYILNFLSTSCFYIVKMKEKNS